MYHRCSELPTDHDWSVRRGSPKPLSVGRQTMVGQPTCIYLATQFIIHIYWVAQMNAAKNWCTQINSGLCSPFWVIGDVWSVGRLLMVGLKTPPSVGRPNKKPSRREIRNTVYQMDEGGFSIATVGQFLGTHKGWILR